MTSNPIDLDDLLALSAAPPAPDPASGAGLIVVDLDRPSGAGGFPVHAGVPLVIVGLTERERPEQHPAAVACDLVLAVGDGRLDAVDRTVRTNPIAAVALVQVL